MGYLATWGPKGFIVSPEKIVTFDGFSTSVEWSEDSQTDTSGKAPTNTNGKKKQIINLSISYVRAAGVDPRQQYEAWANLVGDVYPLYIGGKRFGPRNVRLKKVDLSDLRLSNNGTFLAATVAVSFEEFVVIYASDVVKSPPRQITTMDKIAQDNPELANAKAQAMTTADPKSKQLLKPNSGSDTGAFGGVAGGAGRVHQLE